DVKVMIVDRDPRDNYLDVNEISMVLDKTICTVRYMINKGKFKTAFKTGPHKKWYVAIEEIIKYINSDSTSNVTRREIKASKITKKEIQDRIKVKTANDFTEDTKFVTVKEAKKILNRSFESIYNEIKIGKLKAKKVRNGKQVPQKSFNGKYLISIDSLEKFKREKIY
ncbi:MAG: hypothetical protein ACOCRX_08420, partial [Candidatus Woesearchaeota archaeon]